MRHWLLKSEVLRKNGKDSLKLINICSSVFLMVTVYCNSMTHEKLKFIGVLMVAGFLTTFFRKSRPGIDANVAKEVVRNWQIAKAKALGHKHDIEQLSEVGSHSLTH